MSLSDCRYRAGVAAALATAGLLGLGACGEDGTGEGSTAIPTMTTTASASPELSPSPSETVPVTLTGTVIDGVEPGCLVLRTDNRQFLLLGGDRDVLVPGRRVVVQGYLRKGMATTCMQGVPLVVGKAIPVR